MEMTVVFFYLLPGVLDGQKHESVLTSGRNLASE